MANNELNKSKLSKKTDIFLYLRMVFHRHVINRRFSNNRIKMLETLSEIDSVIRDAKDNKWSEIENIWNTIGFCFFIVLEMMTHVEMMIFERNKIKRIIFLRSAYTNLDLSIKDLLDLIGKKFEDCLITVGLSEKTINELDVIRNDLLEFYKKYKNEIELIIKIVSIHGAKEFNIFFSYYSSIDYSITVQVMLLFDDIVNKIGAYMKKIMMYSLEYIKKNYS